MKAKLLLLGMVIVMALLVFAITGTVNQFTNGNTLESFTLYSGENGTTAISIPYNTYIDNFTLLLTGADSTALKRIQENFTIAIRSISDVITCPQSCGGDLNISVLYVNYSRNGVNTLYDDFEDSSIDTSKWWFTNSWPDVGTYDESGGALNLRSTYTSCAVGINEVDIIGVANASFFNDTYVTDVFLSTVSNGYQCGNQFTTSSYRVYNSTVEAGVGIEHNDQKNSGGSYQLNASYHYRFYSNYSIELVNTTTSLILDSGDARFNPSNISNSYIELGDPDGNYEWNKSSAFAGNENASLNITVINNILEDGCICTDCDIIGTYCSIPIQFHSGTNGILNMSIYNLSYSYGLDNCTEFAQPAMTFFSYEENNHSSLLMDVDGTIEYTFNFINYSNFTISLDDVYNFSLCIYPNWSVVYSDTYLQYEALGGIRERYYIDNLTVTNTTQTINLYNFEVNTGLSELEANLRTFAYAFYPDVIMQMQRYFPALNSWITVQVDRSDEFGKGIFYVYQNEVDYRFNWILDGVLLDRQSNGASTTPLKFICDSTTECEETFVVGRTSVEAQYQNMASTLTYNNATDIILLTWVDTDNVVDTVRLVVEQQAANGVLSICDTTLTSASGSITCDVSGYDGIITARAVRTASPTDPFGFLRIDKTIKELYNALASKGWTNEGGFFAFLIMAVIAGFGATSALATVVIGMLGLIILWMLEITSFINVTFVVTGVALGLIVAYMVKK